MESLIGAKFRLKRAMLNNPAGAIGYVFNQYPDFDIPTDLGIQIILPDGSYDGFSVEEQALYLEFLGIDQRYSMYKFTNVMTVDWDYREGYWRFYE